jgi:hypothetical protein
LNRDPSTMLGGAAAAAAAASRGASHHDGLVSGGGVAGSSRPADLANINIRRCISLPVDSAVAMWASPDPVSSGVSAVASPRPAPFPDGSGAST